jgi:hypothetical protein
MSDDLFIAALTHCVIWDFRSGKEPASWSPSFQEYEFRFADGKSKMMKEPFRFAISPDGNYVVEGGNAALHLYRIEP